MGQQGTTVDVVLAGEQFRWTLGLTWWEFPKEQTGYDGNWVEAEVELVVEGAAGRFTARKPTSILAEELVDFHEQIAALLQSGVGSAEFTTTEAETGLTITAPSEGGEAFEVEGFVLVHSSPELRVRELTTTRRQLQECAHTLREAMDAFPVRGNPRD